MKDKKQKYQEAVERNIKNASTKYQEKSFEQTKQSLGIRKDDDAYDKVINDLIKRGKVRESNGRKSK